MMTCQGQINSHNMNHEKTTSNPLLCDPITGACIMPSDAEKELAGLTKQDKSDKVRVIYFTDPICSSCWGIEPQLRKLKMEYGENIEVEYRMGGLLPDWSYNSGGISKPSDVAHHWDEVSTYYEMPIDGDIWLEDPLDSSYPPSIAFKAAQLQDEVKAIVFLRKIREMVFMQKKNITSWEHLAKAAEASGLNVNQMKEDYNGRAKDLFQADLKLAKEMGVRGFPTMFFVYSDQMELVYGSRPYPFYETAILKLLPQAEKQEYSKEWHSLFEKYQTLTAKEYSVLSGVPLNESKVLLNKLSEEGLLAKISCKNGSLWIK